MFLYAVFRLRVRRFLVQISARKSAVAAGTFFLFVFPDENRDADSLQTEKLPVPSTPISGRFH